MQNPIGNNIGDQPFIPSDNLEGINNKVISIRDQNIDSQSVIDQLPVSSQSNLNQESVNHLNQATRLIGSQERMEGLEINQEAVYAGTSQRILEFTQQVSNTFEGLSTSNEKVAQQPNSELNAESTKQVEQTDESVFEESRLEVGISMISGESAFSADQMQEALSENQDTVVSAGLQIQEEENKWQKQVNDFISRIESNEDRKQVMADISDALKQSSPKLEKLFSTAEMAEEGVGVGATLTDKFLKSAVLLESLTKHDLLGELTGDLKGIISDGADVLGISLTATKACLKGNRIRNLNNLHTELTNSLNTEIDTDKKLAILKRLTSIEKEISTIKEDLTNDIKAICYDSLVTTLGTTEDTLELASFIGSCAHTSSHVLADLAIAGSSIGLASGLLGVTWHAYSAVKENKALAQTNSEISALSLKAKEGNDPINNTILKARVDHLKVQKKEIEVNMSKAIIGTVATGLAATGALKGVLIASGVTLGAAASVSLTAVGGAGVGIGVALAGGTLAYGGYKARHDIKYALSTADIYPRLQIKKQQLKKELSIQNVATEGVNQAVAALTMINAAGNVVDEMQNLSSGETNLKKQALASQQFYSHFKNLDEVLVSLQDNTELQDKSTRKIKSLRKEIADLKTRKENAQNTKTWNKTKNSFKDFGNLATLSIVESMVTERLDNTVGNASVAAFLVEQGFTPTLPVTFDQVFDYILGNS